MNKKFKDNESRIQMIVTPESINYPSGRSVETSHASKGEDRKEAEHTFVRRRLHSLQAIEALLIFTSSGGGPGVGGSGNDLGAIGRKGLDGPCWAMV